MDLVFATEARFIKCCDGSIYSSDGSFSMIIWSRYLNVFDRIIIIARVMKTDKKPFESKYLIEPNRIRIVELPLYLGPRQYLKRRKEILNIIKHEALPSRAYICRVPGQVGSLLARYLNKRRIPYSVEVVGDPWDVFSPGATREKFRPLFRLYFWYILKQTVKKASASLYVTKTNLQKRYPPRKFSFSTFASNVLFDNSLNICETKLFTYEKKYIVKLITIGTLDQLYKSPDIILKTIKILNKRGLQIQHTWIGDGKYRNMISELGIKLNINNINFVGLIPSREKIREFLANSDIFILPSRQEGLPRSLVEAMAMGLPCIATHVGGIPELLGVEVLVPPNDPVALADKIEFMIKNNDFANAQAQRNLKEAQNYREDILQQRRTLFYNEIKRISQESLIKLQ